MYTNIIQLHNGAGKLKGATRLLKRTTKTKYAGSVESHTMVAVLIVIIQEMIVP